MHLCFPYLFQRNVCLVSGKQGLTGLLQSPVRGAERAGLPGMLSGTRLYIVSLTRSHVFTSLLYFFHLVCLLHTVFLYV